MQLKERELDTINLVIEELRKVKLKVKNIIEVRKVFEKPI